MKPQCLPIFMRLALAALTLAMPPPTLAADAYPERPIRMIIPYPPGGSLDPIGRLLGEELSLRLKQPVIIENVAGANGTLGSARAAKAAPDGYTVLVGITSTIALAPITTPDPPYQAGDFDAIGMVGTSGLVLVGKPDLAANSLSELLETARKHPGKLSYAVPGMGSLYHLAMEDVKMNSGANIVAVPYRGAGQASVDVMGGQIDMAVLGLPAMLPHIASGKLKALAVMSRKRDLGNADIPAAAEMPELKNVDYNIWTGLFAPRGLPQAVRQRLHKELQAALGSPKLVEAYAKMGVEVAPAQSLEAFSTFVAEESARLRKAVARTNLQVE